MSGFTRNNQQNNINNIFDYTSSFFSNLNSLSGLQLIAPSSNVNGINIVKLIVTSQITSGQGNILFLAKSTPPANITDGDLIDAIFWNGNIGSITSNTLMKIPAGKGLYAYSSLTDSSITKSVVYKLL